MRAKRSKQYRKLMQQYQFSFNFREPYQVILDAGIIIAAARFKMQLGHMLQNTLHGHIKPMITQCCIRHLYQFEAKTDQEKRDKEAWIDVAKQAERRRCGHHELEKPLSELECIQTVVDPKGSGSNKHRYVVASEDPSTRQAMREIAGVPIVYINRSVMILEPMAARTSQVRSADEKSKTRAGLVSRRETGTGQKRKRGDDDDGSSADERDHDQNIIDTENTPGNATHGRTAGGSKEGAAAKQRRLRGPKGPNPLSVKKPKKPQKSPSISVGVAGQSSSKTSAKASSQDKAGANGTANSQAESGSNETRIKESRKRKRKRGPKSDNLVANGDEAPTTDI